MGTCNVRAMQPSAGEGSTTFAADDLKNFIDGTFVDTKHSFDDRDPATGKVVARVLSRPPMTSTAR